MTEEEKPPKVVIAVLDHVDPEGNPIYINSGKFYRADGKPYDPPPPLPSEIRDPKPGRQ